MAPKKKKLEGRVMKPIKSVKYVARAGMWCTTIIDEKGQNQTWSMEKP
jgi:hypothetical protein